eukprot:6178306-Pleurochrysis_carterae.AAC.11
MSLKYKALLKQMQEERDASSDKVTRAWRRTSPSCSAYLTALMLLLALPIRRKPRLSPSSKRRYSAGTRGASGPTFGRRRRSACRRERRA